MWGWEDNRGRRRSPAHGLTNLEWKGVETRCWSRWVWWGDPAATAQTSPPPPQTSSQGKAKKPLEERELELSPVCLSEKI